MLFLSDEWVEAVDAAFRAVDAGVDDENRFDEAVIRYQVTGGPAGTGAYDVVLGPAARWARRPIGEASVTLTLDWELAVAVNRGVESAQGAFLDGRIMIGGDPQVLLRNADRLAEGNAEIVALRARTVYER